MENTQPYGALTPKNLFAEITYIQDEQTAQRIQQHCLAHGCVAAIAFDAALGAWVWHTLYQRDKTMVEKDIAAQYWRPRESYPSLEARMTELIAAYFAGHGIPIDCYVPCAAGIIDMATQTRDMVFEVKYRLSRSSLYRAIGQVLLYRQAINPDARAVIVGQPTNIARSLAPYVERIGIEIMFWDEPDA